MKQVFSLKGKNIFYNIRQSGQAKNITISIESDDCIEIVKPRQVSDKNAYAFLIKNSKWILDKLEFYKKDKIFIDIKDKSYYHYKNRAFLYIYQRAKYFAEIYHFKYNRINVKKLRSKWGSCSSKGNLNYNFTLLFIPREIADYVIVHELCHLKYLNHSKIFWQLVGSIIPDYTQKENLLKKIIVKN